MAWTTGGKLIEQINRAIRYEEFEEAEELLNDFNSKLQNGYFWYFKESRQKQHDELRALFNRVKSINQLDASVSNYDVTSARESLTFLITNKLISTRDKKVLEGRINELTEEGLFSRIQSVRKDEKESLMEIYAKIYPEGKESKKITTDLIAESFARVLNAINNNVRFEELYAQVHKITQYLEKYAQNGVNLTSIVPVTEFSEKVNKYLSTIITKGIFDSREIRLASKVRYIGKSDDGDIEDLKGRDSEIPIGIEGIVIGYNDNYDDETYTVDFSLSKQSETSSEANKEQLGVEQNQEEFNQEATQKAEILIFGKKGKFEGKIKGKKKLPQSENRNTAEFFPDELEVRESITEIDKNLVRNELTTIEELFTTHYSGKPQQSYKSQDFPKGINELIHK
ncbi:hypothetical protein HZA97_08185 [Candidatus Woesearchaeota archaeon]|nr:hypothetical protein [Candidatus Woesearchaeota archaeon]